MTRARKVFKKISELNVQFKLKELSIGMSSDYLQALKHGATFVRIGSAIFEIETKLF